ncbi:response regulator [Yoonia sp. MH D7]
MSRTTNQALILVVEDEKALRDDLVEELQEAGYRTMAAKDGDEALDVLTHHRPDLLLCDITMPGLDGYGVLRTLRMQRPELATTPFVFLTALCESQEIINGKLVGADDYLVKPVDYDLMLATVSARLRQVNRIRNRHDDEMVALRHTLAGLSGCGAEAALDLITLGIVLLDGHGKPVYMNFAAQEMAAAGFVHAETTRLRSPDPLSERALIDAVSQCLKAARSGQENNVGVMLHRAQDANTLSMLACTLAQSYGNDQPDRPHVALFLSAADSRTRVSEALLIDLFDLTPTEARVAGSLARGNRAADVAKEMQVSQTTMSFHLRNLFQKTGTNRQADLIALILASPMTIRSE